MKLRRIYPWLFVLLVMAGCEPEFEVFAPEKELYVVYGILDPNKDEQFVRINKVYQVEGDAYVYAASNDLSARGFQVEIEGNGRSYSATEVDSVKDENGEFHPAQSLYRLDTRGADALQAGARYTLHIRKPDNPDFHITAWTDVPTAPRIISPGSPIVMQGYLWTFPTVDLSEDFSVIFRKVNAKGYEVRAHMYYEKGGETHQARWGPSAVFLEPVGCRNVGNAELCYEIPRRAVTRTWRNHLIVQTGLHLCGSAPHRGSSRGPAAFCQY